MRYGWETGNDIKVTYYTLPFGTCRYEAEWVGEGNTVWIDRLLITRDLGTKAPVKVGDDFWVGHLHLVVVEFDLMAQMYLCALADGRAYQMIYTRRVRNFLDSIYRRLILTLMVWGLAHVPQMEVPRWEHVGKRAR